MPIITIDPLSSVISDTAGDTSGDDSHLWWYLWWWLIPLVVPLLWWWLVPLVIPLVMTHTSRDTSRDDSYLWWYLWWWLITRTVIILYVSKCVVVSVSLTVCACVWMIGVSLRVLYLVRFCSPRTHALFQHAWLPPPAHSMPMIQNVNVADKTADAAIEKLEKDLHSVSEFLHSRELKLNPAKTQFLVLRKPTVQASRQLRFCGTVVEQSSCAKYLGIISDEHLTFRQQVDALRKKVSATVNAFRCSRTMLTNAARRTIYLSFVQSTLEYASNAYVHSLRQHEYDYLTRISRRSLRTVFGYPPTADVQCILSRNNLTPITIRFSPKLYLLVFRCVHSSASSLLFRLFCLRANPVARSRTCTRPQVSLGLILLRASSRFGYSSLSFLAADRWNSVPASVRLYCFTKSISFSNPRLARVLRKETIGLWGLP